MMATGAYNTLALMSQEEGRHMDSPESVKVRTAHKAPSAMPYSKVAA